MVDGTVATSEFLNVAKREPAKLDAGMCDYFDHLYFSGSLAHEGEKSKAVVMHDAPFLRADTHLPRTLRPLAGFRKIAPGSSRFPLPWQILGAVVG